ncbi:MAG TPA: hypothetical protein VK801_15745 [Caulobacteraceae bacterium]|jgi:hypothetical protein|nr:hypothetical protein [Caulobacteraceae bacterium]
MLRKSIAAAVTVVCVGLAGAAAAGSRLTDTQYVQAARCQALASAASLGGSSPTPFDSLVRDQERGRAEVAYEAAQTAKENAAHEAREAGAYEKSRLTAERDGPCRVLASSVNADKNSDKTN